MSTTPKKSKKTTNTGKTARMATVIPRNNIQGITKPAIGRILRRAGAKRISSNAYEELRGIIKVFLSEMVKNVIVFTEHGRRKTINIEDLKASLELIGIQLAAGLNANAMKTASLQSCNSRGKSRSKGTHGSSSSTASQKGERKPHRFRPGTVSIRQIKYHQKNSDCLAIPKLNFSRLVREIAKEIKADVRFSEGVIDLIQLVTENHLIKLGSMANLCAIHANRETIYSKDLQLVSAICA